MRRRLNQERTKRKHRCPPKRQHLVTTVEYNKRPFTLCRVAAFCRDAYYAVVFRNYKKGRLSSGVAFRLRQSTRCLGKEFFYLPGDCPGVAFRTADLERAAAGALARCKKTLHLQPFEHSLA